MKLNAAAPNKPGSDEEETPQQSPKCAKMLSQLLSNQAESTSNTMKVLSSLLQDDGCSLSSGEQQVAAKMMGKLMQGNARCLPITAANLNPSCKLSIKREFTSTSNFQSRNIKFFETPCIQQEN